MNFAALITEVLRTQDAEFFESISALNLPMAERDCITQIEHYREEFHKLPTIKYFSEAMQYRHLVNEEYQGTSLDALLKSYLQGLRLNTINFIFDNAIAESLDKGSDIDIDSLYRKLREIPTLEEKRGKSVYDVDLSWFSPDPRLNYNTGFDVIDKNYGCRRGNMLGILAQPKTGKSTLLCHLATQWFMKGAKVLFLTFEMMEREIYEKIYSIIGEFNDLEFLDRPQQLRAKQDRVLNRLQYLKEFWGGELEVKQSAITPERLRVMLNKESKRGRPYDIVIVDGFYLMPSVIEGGGWQGVEHNLTQLRATAMGADGLTDNVVFPPVAMLISSQLAPKSDGLDLASIKKSTAIAQMCTMMVSLIHNENTPNTVRMQCMATRRGDRLGFLDYTIDWNKNQIKIHGDSNELLPLYGSEFQLGGGAGRIWTNIDVQPLLDILDGMEAKVNKYEPYDFDPVVVEEIYEMQQDYEEVYSSDPDLDFDPGEFWND